MSHRARNNMSRSTKRRRVLQEIESLIHFDTDYESDHDNTHFEDLLLQKETRCFTVP